MDTITNHDDTASVTARLKTHADMRVERISEVVQLPDLSQFPNARRTDIRDREAVGTFDADCITHLLSLGVQFGCVERKDQQAREVNARCLNILNRMLRDVK